MAVSAQKRVWQGDNVSVPHRVRHGRAMTEADPFIGKILQTRYRVVERVAEGAMGVVYRGERLTLNRIVAIKFLHPAVAQQENLRKRFELEAQAMGRLSHPNCVSVIDFGVQDVPYLVMDFVSGRNLREVISAGGVSPIRVLNIGRQLLAALVHAHAHGIIHRDVKPENLILQQSAGLEDHLRVLDFGLAKLMNSDTGLTGGMAVGTPNYMSPEPLQEGVTDARADLYATGIVLFEMLTGAQPFAADSMGEVLRRQLHMPPPRIREIAPHGGFSAALDELIWKAMAKQPADRFATAQHMLEALERVPELAASRAPAAVIPSAPSTARGLPPPPGKGKVPPSPTADDRTEFESNAAFAVPVQAAPGVATGNLTMHLSANDNIADVGEGAQARLLAAVTVVRSRVAGAWTAALAWFAAATKPVRYGLAGGAALLLIVILFFTIRGDEAPAPSAQTPSPPSEASGTPPPKEHEKAQAAARVEGRGRPEDNAVQAQPVVKTPATAGRRTRRASSNERWGTRWSK